MPSTDNGSNVAVHDDSPCASARVCICRYDTTAAMPASSTTLAVVVHRIHRSPRSKPAGPEPVGGDLLGLDEGFQVDELLVGGFG